MVVLTAAVLYAAGWGSCFAIGYVLASSQILAQTGAQHWRLSFLWCATAVALGEFAVEHGIAPTVIDVGIGHAIALMSTLCLAAVLWIIASNLRAREAAEAELLIQQQQLRHQADTDALTGLANRGAFTRTLEAACEAHSPLTLAFVDLDDFKDLNDSYGHHVGDELLIETARRLRAVVRSADTICRLGGDEFVILITGTVGQTEHTLADRIIDQFDQPWPTISPRRLSASIGLVHDPDGTRAAEELLREADNAMYAFKRGISEHDTVPVMTSRALARHRAAMDGVGGSFTVLRALHHNDHITDWEILEANAHVREYWKPHLGDVIGTRLSTLSRTIDYRAFHDLYVRALTQRTRTEEILPLVLPDGTNTWHIVTVVPLDHESVASIAHPAQTQPRPLPSHTNIGLTTH